jgi:hypothetical protein
MDDSKNTLEKLQTLMVSDVDNNDVNDSDADYEACDDIDFNDYADESEDDDIEVDGITTTLTENGDLAYTNINSPLVDILFKSEYYRKHPDEVSIGTSEKERLFSMMMRDPRYGLGQKVLGRRLERLSGVSFGDMLLAGRADDLWREYILNTDKDDPNFKAAEALLWCECKSDNQLVKKWMPRYPRHNKTVDEEGKTVKSKYTQHQLENLQAARALANTWELTKKGYKKFIKCETTTEYRLTEHREDEVKFEQVPSLAHIKYAHTFSTKPAFAERYSQYLEDVRSGKADIKISVATIYDIYRNRLKDGFEPDLWIDKLEKISGSFMPIIDVSTSMYDDNDSIGKAMSVGYYLSLCSTYCPNHFVTFSRHPQLCELRGETFNEQIRNLKDADWGGNTDLGKVMELLENLNQDELPEWLVILSDMQFDRGCHMKVEQLMEKFRENKWQTKIVWWNFNSREANAPEMVDGGNIFMSGYSPMLLKYLQTGFDAEMFLDKLMAEYAKNVGKEI